MPARVTVVLLVFVSFGMVPFTTEARNLYVSPAGSNGSGLSWDEAYTTVSSAISSATSGDAILVASGVYSVSSGEVFPIRMKSYVALVGAPTGTAPVLQGNLQNAVVLFDRVDSATLERFVVTGGLQGIRALWHSGAIIDCTVTRNGDFSPGEYNDKVLGGGVYLGLGLRILDSAIIDNRADQGGGIYGSGVVVNCLIARNWAEQCGAAMGPSYDRSGLVFHHCTITDNETRLIYEDRYPASSNLGGILEIHNSILWNRGSELKAPSFLGLSVEYSIVQGGYVGEGNIDGFPLFVNREYNNYQLVSGSPGIDQGHHPETPFEHTDQDRFGTPRPQGMGLDMGAYEAPAHFASGEVDPTIRYIHVAENGEDTADGLGWDTALATFQEAFYRARFQDEIWVSHGVYHEPVRVEPSGRLIGFAKDGGRARFSPPTSIDGPLIDVTGMETSAVTISQGGSISGFRVTGVNASIGGGIVVLPDIRLPSDEWPPDVAISECEVFGNFQSGISVQSEGGTYSRKIVRIISSIIHNNTAEYGGAGAYVNALNVLIRNCVFHHNSGRYETVGMGWPSSCYLRNCTIADNSGGGVAHVYRTNLEGTGCILWDNEDESEFTNGAFRNSYYDVGYGAVANLLDIPKFVDPDNGDYRLQPDSPCIDLGNRNNPLEDLRGLPRPIDIPGIGQDGNGTEFDLGAFEFQFSDYPTPTPTETPIPTSTPTPTETPIPTPTRTFQSTDTNGDGVVDAEDLLMLLKDWKRSGSKYGR